MEQLDIFISVGGTADSAQEAFVRAVEDRLRSEGFVPHTVGRNTFSADAPLQTVTECMDGCAGTIVIALERMFFPAGTDKRGGQQETILNNVKLTTPWNQIEAAMSYTRGLPLLMIVEKGIKEEGLIERGHNWYVQFVNPDPSSLITPEFNGVLASWKSKVGKHKAQREESSKTKSNLSPAEMTFGDLLKTLKPAQIWSVLAAIAGLAAGAFLMGAKLFGH